ncbi:nitroreductase family deazaflavin-dependent oxidoreductase [Nocardia camponoti]|uniref:Nitroreductase family deazaflavin-dependent oxidoreductase n=1 Tax=Nocardia camponoti TaxID=1616106 RepID=A0A917QCL2_9NOCA|nr:nitroreductase family deazaflavin-dependent oxidoreductase [Nocardia camponoti]GGK44553.1 hypothetical protein GCM10011591_15190 [Nocardia camponoti]
MALIRKLLIAVIGIVLVGLGVIIYGLRTKNRAILDPFTRLQRDRLNAPQLRTAGEAGTTNGIIYHVGRTSGREFTTPITPFPKGDQFLIGLPYGPETQWMKNVLAAGGATLKYDGELIRVTDPRVVPTESLRDQLATMERVFQQVFGVNEYLVVTRVDA